MTISASALRANLYKTLDQVIATGESPTIVRKGVTLRIVATKPKNRLDAVKKRKKSIINGDPEDLVHIDWSTYWNHDLP
jgi:hypothetical protein